MNDILKLVRLIEESSNIVFLGGAGVSTESNIPDFRSQQGIYNTVNNYSYNAEVMISYTFFKEHTEDFFDFYKANLIYKEAMPSKAHISLANLEKMGKLKAIITQNIDGLHQMAGSKNVLELHGSVHRNYCVKCNEKFSLDYILNSKGYIPYCDKCGGIVRPDVVLYEEGLDSNILNSAVLYIKGSDLLIVGGTSLVVYPAAGLIDFYSGNKLVLINKTQTAYDDRANLIIRDSIGDVLRKALLKTGYGSKSC
ncbi:NAD-dependent protein deacylase [Clostridium sp. DL1XJH146]